MQNSKIHSRTAQSTQDSIITPMRMPSTRPRNGVNVIVENSDSIQTSPAPRNVELQPTSPFAGGVNMSEIDLSSPLNYGTPSSMTSVRTPRSGIRGTPVRVRTDIRTDTRMRQVNIGADPVN